MIGLRLAVPRTRQIFLAGPYALANVASAIASIAAVVLLTRLLSAQGYGLYAAVIGLGTIIQNAGYLALQTSVLRFHAAAEDDQGRRRLASAVRLAFLISSAIVAGAYAIAVLWLGAAGVTVELALAGGILLVLRGWFSLAQAWNRASGRPWLYCALEAVQSFGALIAAILLLQAFPHQPAAALWGSAAATLLAIGCAPALLIAPLRFRGATPLLREMLAYGGPLILVFLAGAMLAVSDRLIVAAYAGAAAAGAYAVAFSIADRAMNFVMLPVPLATKPLIFAAWEKEGKAAVRPLLEGSARSLIHVGFPAVTILIFACAPITRLLAGGGLAPDAARVLPWLAVGSLLGGLLLLHFSLAFQLTRRTGPMAIVLGLPALLNVSANLLLVPRFGMISAGWTTAACYALAVALALILGRREIRIPFPAATAVRTAGLCVPLAILLAAFVR